jgi:two-component sensor histidine kinase
MPDEFFLSAAFPQMYITGIRQREKSGAINDLSGSNKFSYRNNSFNFSFVALDYASQKSIRYFYKLDGLDTNWVSAGSLRSVSYENLSPGHYSFRVKALNNKGRWSSEDAVYSFSISTPFWQTWWFRSLLALAAITAITVYIRKRINTVKTKAAIRQQMTELEVKALRAQMNPHFIFNAMNSIQQFTLKNDVDNANLYISKLSTLLRKVLHSSQQTYITLEEEMEQLNLYLDIEKLRLGNDFSYAVMAGDELEIDALKIPGMLVQPFVENALKHGLAPKEGPKKLTVEFSLQAGDKLQVKITDNGIGRKKAQELKQRQEKMLPYESKGIRLVEDRLKLLGGVQAEDIIRFEDLHDNEGQAAGTLLSLLIPLHTA